jgi:putative membrane protein insertion efficiency factor
MSTVMQGWTLFLSFPKLTLIALVKGYRLLLSPSMGAGCRFAPSCSAYSLEALEAHGAAAGTYLTLRRLARCQPWCDGGHDPVPDTNPFSTLPFFTHLVPSVTEAPPKKNLS